MIVGFFSPETDGTLGPMPFHGVAERALLFGASAAAWPGFMACILSTMYLDCQTLRSRPLDQPLRMNGANVQVAHRPPDSVNRPNVRRRAPSVTAVSAGNIEVDRRD
jgi:hypothetical protein